MLKNIKNNQKGFTIIEVLIVLAIAGLIMLIVFLAIPALQRSQRNNARNTEASRIQTAVGECLGNRNGVVTSCMNTVNVQTGDLQRLAIAPDFSNDNTAPDYSQDQAGVWFGHQCHEDGGLSGGEGAGTIAQSVGNSRSFVVVYQLENDIHRCLNG